MNRKPAPRRRTRRARGTRGRIALALFGATLITAALGYQMSVASNSTPNRMIPPAPMASDGTPTAAAAEAASGPDAGSTPTNTTAFDTQVPGVAKLDPDLLDALQRATLEARGDGVGLRITSAWRSRAYQERLLREAISEHGSIAEASRWVAAPDRSAHVSGDAVDIDPTDAADWLSRNGAQFGLCQIYANERWHFELRPDAAADGCPEMYADPTQDPRLR